MDKPISLELRTLNNMIMRYMDKHSHKKNIDAITGTNGWIIAFIANRPDKDVFQRDLENIFGITRSTASKVVNLMVHKGLVERQSVPYDARLKKLVLTPRAQELSNLMQQDAVDMETMLTKGFSQEEREQLSGFIARMRENVRRQSMDV